MCLPVVAKRVLTQSGCRVACPCGLAPPTRHATFPLASAQVKAEVVKEVAAARRKQHLSSLQYYCALNALQHRKRVAMMEPMLGFAHGQVGVLPRGPRSQARVEGRGAPLRAHRAHRPRHGKQAQPPWKLPGAQHWEGWRAWGVVSGTCRAGPAGHGGRCL